MTPGAWLATSAAMAGVEEWDSMRQTRHKSVVVARRYIRDGSLFPGERGGGGGAVTRRGGLDRRQINTGPRQQIVKCGQLVQRVPVPRQRDRDG